MITIFGFLGAYFQGAYVVKTIGKGIVPIESLIHAKLEPVTFFLCYQLAEYLEGVTDKIEDAADFVKVVAIKSK